MLFNLDFSNNTILSYLFFFLIIGLYYLIPEVICIPLGIPIKEAKAEIEIHPVIVETKIRKYSMSLRVVQSFLCF